MPKSVIVTGGNVRLGKVIADQLREEGWHVLTSSHRADAGADIVADLSEPLGAARLYAGALKLLNGKPPDALVNNAALFVGEEKIIRAVNLEAPKKLTMMMAARETGVGSVVNILDASTDKRETKAAGSYQEVKRELGRYTISSAMTFAATLRVNAVSPGPVLRPTQVHERAGELLLAHRPTSTEVAKAVAYLLSAEATTGCIIPVDGGQSLMTEFMVS